tara:strand:- start:54 stop:731 length:678 start_codon:yes stop_codon:yes gene_type:complete
MRSNDLRAEVDEFQESAFRAISQHHGPYYVNMLDVEYWMFEGCFNPAYAKPSLRLMENQGVEKGDEVLAQFSGPGLDARIAHESGASRVVSVELFEMPYLCARYNTLRAGLEGEIDNRMGDLFEPIDGGETFDLVLANPPFRRRKPEGDVQSAMNDENYTTLTRFWSKVGDHLKPDGRVRAVFSDVGDMGYFIGLAEDNGFKYENIISDMYGARVRISVFEFRQK